jgi:hypothetical protein
VGSGIDRFEGKAFITEYAQPSSQLRVVDPLLQELRQQYPYVTRFYGQMSPEEMTLDPVFDFNPDLSDISNIHDLTSRTDLYPCQDGAINFSVPTIDSSGDIDTTNLAIPYLALGACAALCLMGMGVILGGGVALFVRRKS